MRGGVVAVAVERGKCCLLTSQHPGVVDDLAARGVVWTAGLMCPEQAEVTAQVMRGWRRDVIGEDLLRIMRSQAGLSWRGIGAPIECNPV